ncbi:MAG: hypothetical protein H6Q76_98 [Firmicutes bacterium]|nr:hypothetical protein [Bacillota bacterium]
MNNRHGRQQSQSVRVSGTAVNLGIAADFHDLSQIHHNNPVTDVFDNAQIMGNKYIVTT